VTHLHVGPSDPAKILARMDEDFDWLDQLWRGLLPTNRSGQRWSCALSLLVLRQRGDFFGSLARASPLSSRRLEATPANACVFQRWSTLRSLRSSASFLWSAFAPAPWPCWSPHCLAQCPDFHDESAHCLFWSWRWLFRAAWSLSHLH